jgi:hypothetical protein
MPNLRSFYAWGGGRDRSRPGEDVYSAVSMSSAPFGVQWIWNQREYAAHQQMLAIFYYWNLGDSDPLVLRQRISIKLMTFMMNDLFWK